MESMWALCGFVKKEDKRRTWGDYRAFKVIVVIEF
jgi:hypothetical protein